MLTFLTLRFFFWSPSSFVWSSPNGSLRDLSVINSDSVDYSSYLPGTLPSNYLASGRSLEESSKYFVLFNGFVITTLLLKEAYNNPLSLLTSCELLLYLLNAVPVNFFLFNLLSVISFKLLQLGWSHSWSQSKTTSESDDNPCASVSLSSVILPLIERSFVLILSAISFLLVKKLTVVLWSTFCVNCT